MTAAVAEAAGVPVTDVQRAVMLSGSLPATAEAALRGGSAALAGFGLVAGRPLRPMLAASEPSVEAALAKIADGAGPAAIEWKLDGIRVQAHVYRDSAGGTQVRLFTRTLDEITEQLPEVVAVLARLPVRAAVFDGVQRSPRYPGGVTLRFARVLRYRDDKNATESDTIESVRSLAAELARDHPGTGGRGSLPRRPGAAPGRLRFWQPLSRPFALSTRTGHAGP